MPERWAISGGLLSSLIITVNLREREKMASRDSIQKVFGNLRSVQDEEIINTILDSKWGGALFDGDNGEDSVFSVLMNTLNLKDVFKTIENSAAEVFRNSEGK